jgi:hypothetical protein
MAHIVFSRRWTRDVRSVIASIAAALYACRVMRRASQITLLLLGGGVAVSSLAGLFPSRHDQCAQARAEQWKDAEDVCSRTTSSSSSSSSHASSAGRSSWFSFLGSGGGDASRSSSSSRGGFGATASSFSGGSGG